MLQINVTYLYGWVNCYNQCINDHWRGVVCVVVCSDISMGARVLFVYVGCAIFGKEVQMFWISVVIPVEI